MIRKMVRGFCVVLGLVSLTMVTSCTSSDNSVDEAVSKAAADKAAADAKALAGEAPERIHFGFDSSVLTPEAQESVQKLVNFLRSNTNQLQVEGHCSEEGTTEYNLALGQRRAESVKKAIENQGIAASRIATISYGEERPLDPGHSEDARSKNRRAEFKVAPAAE